MSDRFVLHSTLRSANGRKVQAAAIQLGLAPEIHEVDVYRGEGRSPAYLAINPSGKIPCLVEGSFVLAESNAILQYLSEAHADCALWSREPRPRAAIAAWMFWESAHWQPALSAVLAAQVGHRLLPDVLPAPEAPTDWDHAELRPLLERLETRLSDQPFLAGEVLSLADFCVGGMTTYFRAAAFPFDAFPGIAAWQERLASLPSWRDTTHPLWA